MPYDPLQLKVDVDSITSSDRWKDDAKRRDFIREIGTDASGSLDPESHTQLMGELWNKAEPGKLAKAGKFVGTAVEEVAKSIPAAGGAAALALTDLVGATDSGSGTRLREGVEGLIDTAGQRIKQLDPNDRQEQRDDLLESLKTDLDTGATPEGFTKWLSGAYDNKEIDDPETKQFVDAVVSSISRAGVAADQMGNIDPERLNAFMQSDRNPGRADADVPDQLGARRFLADYAATRDPASWEAFKERVTETDQQYEGRLANWRAARPQLEGVLKNAPDTLAKELFTQRGAEMQGSPIDLASAALPLFRGAKVAQAAAAGGKAASLAKDVAVGALKEGAQEAATEALQDPRATGAEIAEAGALGAVGSGALEGGMAGAGALMRPGDLQTPAAPTIEGEAMVEPEVAPPAPVTAEAIPPVSPGPLAPVQEVVNEQAVQAVAANTDVLPATAAALGIEAPMTEAPAVPSWMTENEAATIANMSPETLAGIERLAAERKTARQIAKELGLEETDVRAARGALGIPPWTAATNMAGNEKENPDFTAWRDSYLARQEERPLGDQAEGADSLNVVQEQGSIPPDTQSLTPTPQDASVIETPVETAGVVENLNPVEAQVILQPNEQGSPPPLPEAGNGPVQTAEEASVEVIPPSGSFVPEQRPGLLEPQEPNAQQPQTSTELPAESSVAEVSIANEPMNIVAEAMGLPRLENPINGTYTHAQVLQDAANEMAQSPQRASLLVEEMNANPRPPTAVEDAILLLDLVNRSQAYNEAVAAEQAAPEDQKEVARQRVDIATNAYAQAHSASSLAGTESGRSLAFRKLSLKLDYSPAAMVTRLTGAKQAPLTQEETTEVLKASNEINAEAAIGEALQASPEATVDLEDLYRRAKEEALVELREEQAAQKLVQEQVAAAKKKAKAEKKTSFWEDLEQAAMARRKERRGNLFAGGAFLLAVDTADLVLIGAARLARGLTNFADWASSMSADFKDLSQSELEKIHAEADKLVAAEEQTETVAKSAIERLQESEGEILSPRWVYDAVKEQVKAGKKTLDEVFSAITSEVQKVMPDVTERQLRDMFSGYGKIKFPSQDEAQKKVRELRRLAQLASAIEDARQKISPMRSGPQRDEATLAVREAQKELHRVMKEMGVERAAGPRSLKTALDAAKSRLRNQIEELDKQIAEGKRTERPRKDVEYDAEAKALEERRDRLKKTLDEIDAPQPPTAQERIQATLKDLDKQIAELERRVKERDAFAPKTESPITEQIQVKRDQRDALTQTLKEIRREIEGDPVLTQEEINEMAERSLTKAIEDLEQQIKDRNFVKPEGPKPENTPAITRLKMKRDVLREQRDKLKEEVVGKKRKTEGELADAAVKSLEKSIDGLEQRIREGDVGAKGRASRTPETAKIKNLRAERDSLRGEVQRLRKIKEEAAKDPAAEQLKADRDHLQRQINSYEKRIKSGDFRPRVKKVKEYDKALEDHQIRLKNLKEEWSKKVFEAQLSSRPMWKKITDAGGQTLNTSRAILTSLDLSGVLRQGGFITLGNPFRSARNIIPMLQAFASKDSSDRSLQRLKNRENWNKYQQSKLYIAETDQTRMSAQEEAFMSRWIDKIPSGAKGLFIGSLIQGSQRSYTTFLNNLRADTFDAMLNTLQKGPTPTKEEMDSIARYINVATGRGDLGKGALNQAAVALNTVFFAPRLVASRFQIIGGYPIFKASGRTKALVLREYAKFLTGAAFVYVLGSLAQEDDDEPLELDPRSSDFLKMRFGDTRVDPMGGLIQSTVFVSRLLAGEKKTAGGKLVPIRESYRLPNLFREVPKTDKVPYGGDNVFNVAANFARSKFSPAFGGFVDITVGENVIGEKVTPTEVAGKMVIPMSFSEAQETLEAHGVPKGTALTTLMLFGAGVQTYNARK